MSSRNLPSFGHFGQPLPPSTMTSFVHGPGQGWVVASASNCRAGNAGHGAVHAHGPAIWTPFPSSSSSALRLPLFSSLSSPFSIVAASLRLTGTSRRWRAVAVHKTPNLEPTPTGKEFPSLRFLRSKMATSNSNAGSHSSITYNSMTPQFVGRSHLHFERLGLGDLVRDLGVVQRFGK